VFVDGNNERREAQLEKVVADIAGPINDTSSVPWTMFNDKVSMGFFEVYEQSILNLL